MMDTTPPDPTTPTSNDVHAAAPPLPQQMIFSTGQAADICQISQQTIIRCFDNGRLNGFRIPGSRFRRIPRADLIDFMKANGIVMDRLQQGKRRLLIIDDDPQITDLFAQTLLRDGRFEIAIAQTSYQAGLMTHQFAPSLILLDDTLPDINGIKVCQTLRNDPQLRHIKLIITANGVDQTRIHERLNAGADAFIKKPFNIDRAIERILELTHPRHR